MDRSTVSLVIRRLLRDLLVLVLALAAARLALADFVAGSYLTGALWSLSIFAMAYVVIAEWYEKGLTGTPRRNAYRWAATKTER